MINQTTEIIEEGIPSQSLDELVKKHKIFIDTCSLLSPHAGQFWKNIIPFLKKYNNRVIIPQKVIEELKKHSKQSEKTDLASASLQTLKFLTQLQKQSLIDVRGEAGDNFADNVFQVVFTKFRMNYHLMLITEDKDLAEDILKLNDSKSVKAKPIIVKRINRFGYLSDRTGFVE